MASRWPPRPIGLGAPFNIAFASRDTRDLLGPWWLVAACGAGTFALLAAIDFVAFGGETLRHIPGIGQSPPLDARLLVIFVGPVLEEVVFRGVVATGAAWLALQVLRRATDSPARSAQVVGTLTAATLAAFWHVGAPETALRVFILNLVINAVYGAFYWWRGLELAVMSHAIVTAILLLAVPVLR
jgi:membrane protease YdiL (CAAX protease family)